MALSVGLFILCVSTVSVLRRSARSSSTCFIAIDRKTSICNPASQELMSDPKSVCVGGGGGVGGWEHTL